jgi:hypothetical protein
LSFEEDVMIRPNFDTSSEARGVQATGLLVVLAALLGILVGSVLDRNVLSIASAPSGMNVVGQIVP